MKIDLDHIALNVVDVDRSVEFYRTIFGFLIERLDEFKSGQVPFPSARINETTLIDLFPPKMWDDGEGSDGKHNNLNHFCLALDHLDWQALRERLTERGIEIYKDKTINFGAKGDGISMYFRDPDGNEIEARYYEAG